MLFATLPESVSMAINIVQPQPSLVIVTELDKNENKVMRLDSQLVLTTCYRNCSLLYSAAEWTEPKLGAIQCRSEQKSTTHVENTVKKKRMGMSPLEIKADAGLQEMKEGDVVDESEPQRLRP